MFQLNNLPGASFPLAFVVGSRVEAGQGVFEGPVLVAVRASPGPSPEWSIAIPPCVSLKNADQRVILEQLLAPGSGCQHWLLLVVAQPSRQAEHTLDEVVSGWPKQPAHWQLHELVEADKSRQIVEY